MIRPTTRQEFRARRGPARLRRVALAVAMLTTPALLSRNVPAQPASAKHDWIARANPEARDIAPGRLLVKFRSRLESPSKLSASVRSFLGPAAGTAQPLLRRAPAGPLPGGVERLVVFDLPPETDIVRLASKLSRFPEVEYAEPMPRYETVGDPTMAELLATPNDPQYPINTGQRYLDAMQVEAAWDVVKGETNSPVVCVIDGGTNWQHEDLQANMWTNAGEIPGNGIDDDGNGYIDDVHGWDFPANDGDPRGNFASLPSNANHGTHTGGLLAAVTNNGVGVASASWNPRLMAVNASGSQDGSIGYGYDGIVYAAENGADIVSLSWGGFDATQAGQDVIDFAVSQGTLVIAAAGNNGLSRPFFPAAYRHVIAVANVWGHDPNGIGTPPEVDERYGGTSASNYGGWLDVAAAGTAVYSTFDFGVTNQYGASTGTSMSCPVAAAVAALIQSQHPTWGPLQVGEQLRVTCDNLTGVNPSFADLLGRGRVNALRAVTESSPAVRVVDWSFQDADGNGELNRGENVFLSVDLLNYLAPATGITLDLSSTSPYVNIVDATEAVGDLGTLAGGSFPAAFAFSVAADAPAGTAFDLRLDITATGYDDFQWLPIVLEPVVETHDVNQIEMSLTGTGHIGWLGFPGGLNGEQGQGFRFQGGDNLLYEGALLLGTGPTALSDAARTNGEHTDFAPADDDPPFKLTPGASSDQEIFAPFADTENGTTPLGVRVDLASRAFATPPDEDFIYLGYTVTNTSGSAFTDLWIGLFFDWDIDEVGFQQNSADWDASRRLGYAWNGDNASLPHVGVMALGGPQVGYSAIRNDGSGQPVNLYDGFTKSEKWTLLNGGTGIVAAGPADISQCLSVGPYALAAGESLLVWFALLAGTDLQDLQSNADRAISLFGDSIQTSIEELPPEIGQGPPRQLELGPATPNPFNPGTQVLLSIDRPRHVRLDIYDVRGRRVRRLADRSQSAGVLRLTWDGRDDAGEPVPSGVYMLTLRSERQLQVQRLVLTR